jgi:hypothetical protein
MRLRWEKPFMAQITDPGKVVIVEVPVNWTPREAQREQTRVARNIIKTGAPVHVIVVRGAAATSLPADYDDGDDDDNGDNGDEDAEE